MIKNFSIIFFVLIFFQLSNAQIDKHGNPVFNSETLEINNFDGYDISALYYTINNNISNKKSNVYISDSPSLKDYLRFSMGLPSYTFIITVKQVMKYGVMVMPSQQEGKINFLVISSSGQKLKDVSLDISGEVTEGRANELIKIKADKNAEITEKDGTKTLSFDKNTYRIIPYESIKKEAVRLAAEVMKKEEIKNPTEYIKRESVGGKMDFEKTLDPVKIYVVDNIGYTQPEMAIYLWSKTVKRAGIKSEEEAMKLWEEVYKKELTEGNKKAFHAGFTSE